MSPMGRTENQGTANPRIERSHSPPTIADPEPNSNIGQLMP
jgi:hypothetical protein